MTRRTRAVASLRPTIVCAALVIGGLAFAARPAAAQFVATWVPLERADPGPTIGAGFAYAITHNGQRTTELVLTAHRIQGGRVVATHRSSSFTAEPGRPFRLDERYLPAPRFYEGKIAGETVIAPAPVPLASGERDANVWWERLQERFITDWGEFRSLEEWERSDALLMVVGPADARLRSEGMGHPMLVWLKAASR